MDTVKRDCCVRGYNYVLFGLLLMVKFLPVKQNHTTLALETVFFKLVVKKDVYIILG